jgi:hypothetical protein
MMIHGECHCGAIAYEADVDPLGSILCSCSDCQKLSGSPFRASVPAKAEHFKITRGIPKIYVKTADSGRQRAQGFCENCGTPIFASEPKDAHLYMLRLGAVRQRAEIPPLKQIWRGSALTWAQDVSILPATDKA